MIPDSRPVTGRTCGRRARRLSGILLRAYLRMRSREMIFGVPIRFAPPFPSAS